MKHTILTSLSILALAAPLALPVAAEPSVSPVQTSINKQSNYVDPQDDREYQAMLAELDKMFEQERQMMMAEMNARLDQMHTEMVRILNEQYRRSTEQRLNR